MSVHALDPMLYSYTSALAWARKSGQRERERERGGGGGGERERQTDSRWMDGQTDRQTHTRTNTQTDRQTHTRTNTQTDRQA